MFSHPSHLDISEHAQQHRAVIKTYCELSIQPALSDRDAAALDNILATAETDPLLSFLLDEADHMLGHLYNFIDDASIAAQQRQLQTCLDESWFNQAFQDLTCRLQTSQCKHLQAYLKQAGYYQGDIDGVMGPDTKNAMQQYFDQHDELPQPSPIHTPDFIN